MKDGTFDTSGPVLTIGRIQKVDPKAKAAAAAKAAAEKEKAAAAVA